MTRHADRRWLAVCVGAALLLVAALYLPARLLTDALGDHWSVALATGVATGIVAGLGGAWLAYADLRRRRHPARGPDGNEW